MIVSIATIGFNLLLGYTGMLSYGHAMFFGGGGYIAAILLVRWMPHHPNLWLAVARRDGRDRAARGGWSVR